MGGVEGGGGDGDTMKRHNLLLQGKKILLSKTERESDTKREQLVKQVDKKTMPRFITVQNFR